MDPEAMDTQLPHQDKHTSFQISHKPWNPVLHLQFYTHPKWAGSATPSVYSQALVTLQGLGCALALDPILPPEPGMHLNLHQFNIQFKWIISLSI